MAKRAAFINPKQVQTILDILENDKTELKEGYQLKYKTIFAIGIYTGLRIGEIITLKYQDVYTPRTVVDTLKIKRLKKREKDYYSEIPVHPKLKRVLLDYRYQYDAETNPVLIEYKKINTYLFFSTLNKTGHISYNGIRSKFDDIFERVGLRDGSTHSMRRTALTMMKNAGVPLPVIRNISGHSSLEELVTYLEVTPDDSISAINKIKY